MQVMSYARAQVQLSRIGKDRRHGTIMYMVCMHARALALRIKFLSRRNLIQFIEDGIEKRAKAFIES